MRRLRPHARRGRRGQRVGARLDLLDGLAALVDQSLLRSDEAGGEARFTMLEPIREYAAERLEASGDARARPERHAQAYLALAQECSPS